MGARRSRLWSRMRLTSKSRGNSWTSRWSRGFAGALLILGLSPVQGKVRTVTLPFDRLTALSEVEGLTVLTFPNTHRENLLTTLSLRCILLPVGVRPGNLK